MTARDETKIRVVIAEDEPPIGRFLRRLVEQTEGFEVAAVCLSGETAIEAVRELKAGLIITDIRMSGMTGLELVSGIKKEAGDIRSIIVTGYKMFEYAREAIHLGIDAFITKPVNQQELRQALEAIRESHRSTCKDNLRRRLEMLIRTRDEEAFRRAMPFESVRSLIIYYSGESRDTAQVIRGVNPALLYAQYKEAVVVFEDAEEAQSDFDTIVTKLLCRKDRRRTCVCVEAACAASDGSFVTQLRQFYRNTVRRLVTPGKSGHYRLPGFGEGSFDDYRDDDQLFRQAELEILAKNREHIQQKQELLFENWKAGEASIFHMRRQLHAITSIMEQAGLLARDKVSVNDQIDEGLMSLDGYDEIRDVALRCWARNMVSGEEGASRRNYRMFEQIREFIQQNRSQNYSLQEICGIFKASPPYIRKVFKLYTGKTYNEYTVEQKIEYAARLIDANPEMYVKDIADMLGYEQLYFGTVFKKVTGVSPSRYRELAAERKNCGAQDK